MTAITAAVPIIIARVVRKDLTILDLIEVNADIIDSLTNIIQS
jgi:hypothetical protein